MHIYLFRFTIRSWNLHAISIKISVRFSFMHYLKNEWWKRYHHKLNMNKWIIDVNHKPHLTWLPQTVLTEVAWESVIWSKSSALQRYVSINLLNTDYKLHQQTVGPIFEWLRPGWVPDWTRSEASSQSVSPHASWTTRRASHTLKSNWFDFKIL